MNACTHYSKSPLRRNSPLQVMTLTVLFPALLLSTGPVSANPSGGVIVHGDVSIAGGGNGMLNINQNSNLAIINWSDFNIAVGETTRFNQPGAQASVLNRVTGGDPSAIHGALQANGNVFVINPNGILVGPTGMIDVHGLVLSTLDLKNGEFLAGGDMTFLGSGDAGVVNMGKINAIGGDVFLFGNTVSNEGSIVAREGTVGIGAGREVLLAAKSNPMGERVFVRAGGSGSTGILNTGSIEGAAVELKAHGNMYALAINNKGSIRAVGAVNQGGRAFLRGVGGSVSNSGSIEVTSSSSSYAASKSASAVIQAAYARVDGAIRAEGGSVLITGSESVEVGGSINVSSGVGKGGDVTVEGNHVAIGGSSVIDASGSTGGGSVRIGGGLQGRDAGVMNADLTTVAQGALIIADATESGDGGSVVVWADGDTVFEGGISATGMDRGGFAEISGKRNLNIDGSTIDLGQGGFLLLDPSNFTVSDAVRTAIRPTLNAGSDVVIFTNGSDTLAGNGNIIFSSDFSGLNAIDGVGGSETTGSLSLLAYGDIFMRRDLVNNGTGNVNLVAGWDGMTPSDFTPGAAGTDTIGAPPILMDSQIFADTSTYGNRNGSVYIGLEIDKVTPTNVSTITVGSRNGETNVAAYNLVMVGDNTAAATSGDDRTAQLGYRASDVDVSYGREAATGRIKVNVLNDVTMTAGTKTNATALPSGSPGQYNYVQIGHGGRDAASNGYNHSGEIIVQAGLGSDAAITGNIIGTAGSNIATFVHIGHGGHGGSTSSGGFSGAITVEAGDKGRVEMTAGTGRRAFAMIGHGGYDVDGGTNVTDSAGFHSGNIKVSAGTDVIVTAGIGGNQFATDGYSFGQIGHGGANSGALSSDQGHNGSITVEAGRGGVSGGIAFTAGDIDDNYAQLGHGGVTATSGSGADGHNGAINVDAIGDITFTAGTGQAFRGDSDGRLYAQLGHGGYNAGSNLNVVPDELTGFGHHGLIEVNSTKGNISFFGGDISLGSAGDGFGRIHYAQLGHGGYHVEGDHYGSVIVEATEGSVIFTAGATEDNATDGIRNSAQLGHGGYLAKGDHGRADDVISVTAGADITFTGGGGTQPSGTLRSYAQLGNGGYDAENPTALTPGTAGNLGEIRVVSTGGNITFTGGPGAEGYAQLGHGGFSTSGDHFGNISVSAFSGAISFSGGAGADTYAQLGHGGRAARGYSSGVIEVASRDDIAFRASTGSRSYVQIGHGGHDADSPNAAGAGTTGNSGAIRVSSTEGSVILSSGDGTGSEAYAQIGHGGLGTEGDHSGSILVRAANTVEASAAVTGGTGINGYVQLGHGGMNAIGNHSGAITVSAGTNGAFTDVFDLGGNGIAGDADDAITFVGGGAGSISFSAGFATDRYAQLGHGGRTARGDHSGTIEVNSVGDITFAGGTAGQTYSKIGHGGRDADNPNPANYPDNDPLTLERGPAADERVGNNGDIAVSSTGGNVIFTAGSGTESFVQIGHGGAYTDGDHFGDITVSAIDILFDASNPVGSVHFAQLGHGGYLASGGHIGNVSVIATGAINFSGGTSGSYTQIGHGGYNDHRVTRGGTSPNYTQTNNNDRYYSGTHSGAILVSAGTDIGFTGGIGTGSYGQIGHGGYRNAAEAGEGHSGNISVVGGGGVSFAAQNGAQAYVQVGHGGYEAFGNHGYQVVRTEAGSIAATQAGSASLANGALAPGSLRITVDPEGSGAGTATFTDDGFGNLIDGTSTVVGSVNYLTGEVSFSTNVNSSSDVVEVAYLHGGSDILVDGGTGVLFAGGTGSNTSAQIGHGGPGSSFSSTLNIQPEESAPASNTSSTTYHLNTPSANPLGTGGNISVFSGTGNTAEPSAAVSFTTGAGNDAYAQIGNGGRNARGDHRGEIAVAAAGDISFVAFDGGSATATTTNNSTVNARLQNHSSGTFTLAQTGNLERGTIVITYENPIPPYSGTIYGDSFGRLFDNGIEVGSVTTAGVVTLTETLSDSSAGAANSLVVFDHLNLGLRSYAQIGHGGHDADNPNATTPGDPGNLGNITVTSNTGAIHFAAGSRNESYAQLGHGGYVTNGDHSGNIIVEALGANGAITFAGGSRNETYTQLGHGGRSAKGNFGLVDVDNDGIADGDITVRTTGSIQFTSGAAGQAYAQLGHGGYDADTVTTPGNPSNRGTIFVESNTGDIVFSAAGSVGANSYTQLGHGGLSTSGDFSGAITARALGGSILFTGGETTDSYAQLGHGGRGARGSHDGDIEVLGANGVTFAAGGVATVSGESSAALVDAAVTGGGATGTLVNLANLDRSSLVITINDPLLPEYAIITSNSSGVLSDGNGDQVGTLSTAGVVTFTVAVANVGASGLTVAYNHANYSRGSAQLGNGGSESDATGSAAGVPGMSGDIKVASTAGSITFTAGLGDTNYVQLGNGGYATSGDHSGHLTVRAAGDISFVGGSTATTVTGTLASRANNYAQLGNGGMSGAGNHEGSITVSAGTDGDFDDASTVPLDFVRAATGGIVFDAGTITDTYAQLGHGGRLARGNHSGEIEVSAYDTILFENGVSTRTYVQLGHGGHDAGVAGAAPGDSGNSGGIKVESTAGAIEFRLAATTTSPGTDAYAQLGHGGNLTGGDHTGDIDVFAETNLLFRSTSSSGTGSDTYVQLGHGGIDTSGNFNGDITATANTGYAQFRSGTSTNTATTAGNNRYAQLGHGGTNSSGNYSGDIKLLADAAITFSNQGSAATIGSYTQLGHGGFNVTSSAGHTGDIAVTSRAANITFTGAAGSSTDSYSQLGHGGTNATGSHFGNIAVQSAMTTIFTGGSGGIRSYAQLGHGGYNADALAGEGHGGRIGVAAGTNLTFTAGSGASQESYAQLGHGGFDASGDHSGDIVARAGNTLIFTASTGTDTLIPDSIDPINNPPTQVDNRGYAQLGHGGYAASGNHSGNITASSQLTGDFTDIGDFDGDGFADVISMVGGVTTTNPFSFLAGSNATTEAASDAYAQLGHGGRLATGTNIGDILVDAERTVRYQAGALGARTYAQLGHGGHDAASVFDALNPIGLANSGDISVTSRTGAVNLLWIATTTDTSDGTYVQLGHGGFVSDPLLSGVDAGGNNTGDITVNAGTSLLLRSTTSAADSSANYVQLGHGGMGWVGDHSGDINATAGTSVATASGAGNDRYTQIGHGGTNATGNHDGDVTVQAGTSITFTTGAAGIQSYAQLGHGGVNVAGNHAGDLKALAGTSISFVGTGTEASGYAQLGHGGIGASGDHSGSITALANSSTITFTGGIGADRYAQLGHGGTNASGNFLGDIAVLANGTITFNSGTASTRGYTQLGHGGYNADSIRGHSGNIGVGSRTGNIAFTASGGVATEAYAQLGHGGFDAAGAHNGDIVARAGNEITFTASTGSGSVSGYAQLGHGGAKAVGSSDPDADLSGDITVSSRLGGTFSDIGDFTLDMVFDEIDFVEGTSVNGLRFLGGTGTTLGGGADAYAQLGHGGRLNRGSHEGDIAVDSGSQILFQAGGIGARTYAQLGHGGHDSAVLGSGPGTTGNTGAITVNAGTNLDFRWAATSTVTSSDTYLQLGHGGFVTDLSSGGDNRGDISVSANNILFRGTTGATSTSNFVQLGHGGLRWTGNHSGNINVSATGTETANPARSIAFLGAGSAADRYVQLGHGGRLARGNHGLVDLAGNATEAINVTSFGDIVFTGGTGTRGYAMIGNGGSDSDLLVAPRGSASNINVTSTAGSVLFSGNTGDSSYAQIGNGGYATSGAHRGDIVVSADEDIKFLASQAGTAANGYVQLGNGGRDAAGNHSGNISVTASNGGIEFAGGAGNDRYAQLGHGGRTARGDHSGTIAVQSAGDINFTGYNGGPLASTTTNSATLNNLLLNDAATNYTMAQTANFDETTIVITYQNPLPGFSGTIVGDGAGRLFDGTTQVGTVSAAGVINLSVTVSDSAAGSPASVITFQHLNLGLRAYAQLGHGGNDADFPTALTPGDPGNSGDVFVVSDSGSINFTGGSRNETYAQLGHGGMVTNGAHRGSIAVKALGTDGEVNFFGGTRVDSYAQLGHGGRNAVGDHGVAGNTISVVASDVNFSGGDALRTYAQLGNGGHSANGNLAGDIQIDAVNNLSITGGTGLEAYGLVGHGGVAAGFVTAGTSYTTGTRTGNILANVGGTTTLVDESTIGFMGHLGTSGVATGSRLALITGMLDTSATLRKTTGMIQNMIAGGGVEIGVTGGNLLIDGSGVFAGSSNEIDLFAKGDVTFVSSVQNAGTGGISVVGGWDGSTGLIRSIDRSVIVPVSALSLDADSVFADANAYGDAGGVTVGTGAQTRAAVVGSANGSTRVAGQFVEVSGSSTTAGAAAQIGFNEEVHRLGGGVNGVASTGAITVFTKEGGLALQAGSVADAAAQIGHGGTNGTSSNFRGDIIIDLGKGSQTADLSLRGGQGADSYAQIGHGGRRVAGAKSGELSVVANAIEIIGGSGNFGSAGIGHGGGEGSGAIEGAINVIALADVSLLADSGDFATAGIGHGGAFYAGSIDSAGTSLQVGGDLELRAGSGVLAIAQVGHGGPRFSGDIAGNGLVVDVANDIEVTGGTGNFSYAQIGSGGYAGSSSISGDIEVSAGNDITLWSVNGSGASYVKIGHGDDLAPAIASLASTGSWSGDVTVGAGRNLTMRDAMIGHAGKLSKAAATGGITRVGVSRNSPDDPSGGTLTADTQSEFAGEDELRFYLPSRGNNAVASGALLNGVTYSGAKVDPSPTQGSDEFTIRILGDEILFPNEHTNLFGSGPAPANAAGYAFYYDYIVIEALPDNVVDPGVSGGGAGGGGGEEPGDGGEGGDGDLFSVYGFDDEETDDAQRKRKRFFRVGNPYQLLYQGYTQYGPNGESIFDYSFQKEEGGVNSIAESPLID